MSMSSICYLYHPLSLIENEEEKEKYFKKLTYFALRRQYKTKPSDEYVKKYSIRRVGFIQTLFDEDDKGDFYYHYTQSVPERTLIPFVSDIIDYHRQDPLSLIIIRKLAMPLCFEAFDGDSPKINGLDTVHRLIDFIQRCRFQGYIGLTAVVWIELELKNLSLSKDEGMALKIKLEYVVDFIWKNLHVFEANDRICSDVVRYCVNYGVALKPDLYPWIAFHGLLRLQVTHINEHPDIKVMLLQHSLKQMEIDEAQSDEWKECVQILTNNS